MKMWSVETEANSWNDDEFNGTFAECVQYCKVNDYKIDGVFARFAEIEIDDRGCVIDTYRIVEYI